MCRDCPWRERPDVCSDERNLRWGYNRNRLAHFQCNTGDNRKDYNDDPTVHEVPEFFCLDPEFWRPDLDVPDRWRLDLPESTVRIYHAVGQLPAAYRRRPQHQVEPHLRPADRADEGEGYDVELTFVHGVPNREVRFTQVQADIVVDMLTFGWFGSNVREAMMLGKPVVCYLRPEWLERMRREIPEYIDELPVVSATPETVEDVLKDLVRDPNGVRAGRARPAVRAQIPLRRGRRAAHGPDLPRAAVTWSSAAPRSARGVELEVGGSEPLDQLGDLGAIASHGEHHLSRPGPVPVDAEAADDARHPATTGPELDDIVPGGVGNRLQREAARAQGRAARAAVLQ